MKQCCLILITILFIAKTGLAQQGNYKFNNFGNRSILLSGNVTGSVTDLGLVYYNPARLTEVENTGFAFNARAYQLSSINLSNFLGQESRISSTNFNGIPSMAGGTFELFGSRFAYSFISRSKVDNALGYNNNSIGSDISEIYPDTEAYKLSVLLKTGVKDDWVGLTWAKKISSQFSAGVSVFGSVYKYNGGSNLNHTIQSSNNQVALYQNSVGFSQESYGFLIKIGANYHFESFDLGLNINMPYLEIYDKGKFVYSKIIAGANNGSDQFYDYEFKTLNAERQEPLGISLGAGIPFGQGKFHVNMDYVTGIKEYDRINIPDIEVSPNNSIPVLFKESRRPVFNFGTGLEVYINEKTKSFFGFSTDYNAFIKNANIFDLSSDGTRDVNIGEDFNHYSLGIDLKLNWVSIVLGTTFTNGSTEFINPSRLTTSGVDFSNYTTTKIDYSRWQFVIGIEIPVLDKIDPQKEE